jgi:hypothetical protein
VEEGGGGFGTFGVNLAGIVYLFGLALQAALSLLALTTSSGHSRDHVKCFPLQLMQEKVDGFSEVGHPLVSWSLAQ